MAPAESERGAIRRALELGLASQVRRIVRGVYQVPSTSEPDVRWTVTVVDGVYDCTCRAAYHPACVHRAAVYLARLERNSRVRVVGVRQETPAPRRRGRKEVALV